MAKVHVPPRLGTLRQSAGFKVVGAAPLCACNTPHLEHPSFRPYYLHNVYWIFTSIIRLIYGISNLANPNMLHKAMV
jgi:hypothetical protein